MLDDISRKLYSLLEESCNQCDAELLLLSGGLDSSILAFLLRDKNPKTVAVIAEDFVSTDLTYSQMISKKLGLELSIFNVATDKILEAVENTVKILKNFNDIEIRNSVVMYLAVKWAKDNGFGSVVTGDGADELFAGYNFLVGKPENELESEIKRVCSVMHFPTQEIGKTLGIRIESPYLSEDVAGFARDMPPGIKVRDENGKKYGKWILRKTFEEYIPRQIAWRAKSPMQDGSGTVGLTELFESVIDEEKFVEKKLAVEAKEGVTIRTRESMYYYEIFRKYFGPPVSRGARRACPYCKHEVKDSKFCRMCGAFPI